MISIQEDEGSIPGLDQEVKDRSGVAGSCGVGGRQGSDLVLLWLWRRPETTAPIQPLAWESPYVVGVALKKPKRKERKKSRKKKKKKKPSKKANSRT